jgi:ArsR family transcriptional regulator
MQMVLHYAEDPAGVVMEAARVLRPGGRLIVIDLAAHDRADLVAKRAHRWSGFADTAIVEMLSAAGLLPTAPVTVPGPLDVRIWPAERLP